MDDLYIPETDAPKVEILSFGISKEDKQYVKDFVARNNYRMSAFLRVAVLTHIRNAEKEGK